MLELLDYLRSRYHTRAELLACAGVADAQLAHWQDAGMMPAASYTLDLQGACNSFFGPHETRAAVEYHARGYTAWIGALQMLENGEQAMALFARRYRAQVAALRQAGYTLRDARFDAELDAHIAAEWTSFLKGIYGLCTVSGLPEDIAGKELATALIKELTADVTRTDLGDDERARLARAVDLLDVTCAPFAPHERARSSRARLVDGVRRAYKLERP
jgi:hypothetical protein